MIQLLYSESTSSYIRSSWQFSFIILLSISWRHNTVSSQFAEASNVSDIDGNKTEPEPNEPKENPRFRKNRTELELQCRKHKKNKFNLGSHRTQTKPEPRVLEPEPHVLEAKTFFQRRMPGYIVKNLLLRTE